MHNVWCLLNAQFVDKLQTLYPFINITTLHCTLCHISGILINGKPCT